MSATSIFFKDNSLAQISARSRMAYNRCFWSFLDISLFCKGIRLSWRVGLPGVLEGEHKNNDRKTMGTALKEKVTLFGLCPGELKYISFVVYCYLTGNCQINKAVFIFWFISVPIPMYFGYWSNYKTVIDNQRSVLCKAFTFFHWLLDSIIQEVC